MGHGQYLLFSWMSSIFEECIIVFQVLGHHIRIPCIFHGILMVKSNESNTSSHFHVERNLFFQSLESEVSLLLSVVPLVLPLSLAFCKVLFRSSLCFLFSIVFSCGRSDSVDRYFQSVHQHLQAIALRASAFAVAQQSPAASGHSISSCRAVLSLVQPLVPLQSIVPLLSHVATTHWGNIWVLPCLALACSSLMSNTRQEKQAFSEQMGQCLADRGFVIFWLSFRYRLGYRLEHLVGSRKKYTNKAMILEKSMGNPFVWKVVVLSWGKLDALLLDTWKISRCQNQNGCQTQTTTTHLLIKKGFAVCFSHTKYIE